jgi:very-short-patch-repair endonuclease
MFSSVTDYAELLLPDRLFAKDCVVYDLANSPASIPADDFNVKEQGQVEIIGWLYQYYISEKKDEVFAALKKNVKITKENVPAATQLFTPDWIVRYMVENSLGRLWLEGHPNAALQAEWKYYIPDAEQTPEVTQLLSHRSRSSRDISPTDIRFIDPCMGSGHILVYAFDVLFQIYVSAGYAARDIPDLILTHNLYGLDIDERACQLTYFALNMKARAYNRRFLRRETAEIPQPRVFATVGDADLEEYGSLTKVTELGAEPAEPTRLEDYATYADRKSAWNARNLLAAKYDVVVTNPPYMGASGMGVKLYDYTREFYPDSKSDIFAAFIEKCRELLKANGFQAMITMQSWMFLPTFQRLREKMIADGFVNLAHLGARSFDEISGEVVQTVTFVMQVGLPEQYRGTFVKLTDYQSQEAKGDALKRGTNRHYTENRMFSMIPESSLVYWISHAMLSAFRASKIADVYDPKTGVTTGDNTVFMRFWHEVAHTQIGVKWFPMNKGGTYRKWYGNNDYVVDWEDNGQRIKSFSGSTIRNEQYYFREGVTWSKISTGNFAGRYSPQSNMFDAVGLTCFSRSGYDLYYLLAFMCSSVANRYVKMLNPTLSYTVGTISNLPIIFGGDRTRIDSLVTANIALSRADWDAFETSWDFKRHPLVQPPPPTGGTPFEEGGKEGVRPYNAFLMPMARELRTGATRQENHLWYDFLRSYRPRFTRQRIFGNYILDFYCSEAKLAIELDGSQHFEPDAVKKDQVRTEFLNNYGVTVIRFPNNEIDHNFDGVCTAIKAALSKAPFSEGGAPQGRGLSAAFAKWERECEERFQTLKRNEEELNRIFIDIYGLQDELTPEVTDKDVTVRRADKLREVKSFVSYAVGCMFGRYSLDVDGLAYAGGAWDAEKYTTFLPDKDNILPINDEADYFDDDIVVRFAQFVRAVYGEQWLENNLAFIADTLYPDRDGSARDKIRRYFANDFYKDHVKTYQKKPIYWQFDSGKHGGFKALVYLHRYDKYTVGRVRTEYMHPQQRMYDDEIKRIEQLADLPETTPREKALGQKRVELLRKKIAECREYDAVIAHVALRKPELDLDDGVTANYAKFQGVEVAVGDGRPPKKMDLLTKI